MASKQDLCLDDSSKREVKWKRKLNALHFEKDEKHAFYMAIYMVYELNTTLAKAKKSASVRYGVPMNRIESVVKEVLGQSFFDARSKWPKP